MIKRFVIALLLIGVAAGGIVGFNLFRDQAVEDFFANRPVPALPVTRSWPRRAAGALSHCRIAVHMQHRCHSDY